MSVFVDPDFAPDGLREALYRGNVIVLTRLGAVEQYAAYMREELRKLFSPHDPEHAHEHLSKEAMASQLGVWKPKFIHSEESRFCEEDHPGSWLSDRAHILRRTKAAYGLPGGPPNNRDCLCLPVA